jgi:hypothetical protein
MPTPVKVLLNHNAVTLGCLTTITPTLFMVLTHFVHLFPPFLGLLTQNQTVYNVDIPSYLDDD